MDKIDYIKLTRKLYDLKCDFAYKLHEIKQEFGLNEEDLAITICGDKLYLPIQFTVVLR